MINKRQFEAVNEAIDCFEIVKDSEGEDRPCFKLEVIKGNGVMYNLLSDLIRESNTDIDSTYIWTLDLLNDMRVYLESSESNILENIDLHESIDSKVEIYANGLAYWLCLNNKNLYYLTEAIEEGASDGFNALSLAQYKAIEEVAYKLRDLIADYVD